MDFNTTALGNVSKVETGSLIKNTSLTTLEVGYYFLRVLWFIFALFGNILTITAVITSDYLQNATNSYVVSLAVADILTALTAPFFLIEKMVLNQRVLYWACAVKSLMIIYSGFTMLFSTFLIALDRYIFLHHPLRYYNIMTIKVASILILVVWLGGAVLSFPPTFLINNYHPGDYCDFTYVYAKWLQSIIIVPLFTIQMLVTFALYIKISHLAFKKSREISGMALPQDVGNTSQMKITKMMLIVIGVYFICYTPRIIFSVTLPHPPRSGRSGVVEVLHYLSFLLWFCSSWCNPLVYALKNADFRKAFKSLLTHRHVPQHDRSPLSHSCGASAICTPSLPSRT